MRKWGTLIIASLLLPALAYAATININTATAVELDTLPGIGPTKAAAIVDYRTKNGAFATIEDIEKVSGIGPVTFSNIQALITVGATSTSGAQPPAGTTSYQKVQAVAPVISTNTKPNDDAVDAPATTTTIVAAGAVLPPDPEVTTQVSRTSGLFSLWTLGLAGVILVAGGAFILL